MSNAPILIFAYNRPKSLARLLASLAMCDGYDESPVVIHVDGPKNEGDAHLVEEVRGIAMSVRHNNVQVIARPANLGLRASVMAGIDDAIRQYDSFIVLEDDLTLSSVAIRYFNDALRRYKDVDRLWSVSGYMYYLPALQSRRAAFFLPHALPWGWASWRRSWRRHTESVVKADYSMLTSRSFRRALSVNGLSIFPKMLELSLAGQLSSWYLPWLYDIVRCQGLTLFPPQSMVANTGTGAGGTHATRWNPHRYLVRQPPLATRLPALPDEVVCDFKVLDLVPNSWEARVRRYTASVGWVKRKIRRALRRGNSV